MNERKKRLFGIFIIGLTYLFASVVGIGVFFLLPFEIWLSVLVADVVATVVVFIVSVICSNASVYDPYWSVQPIIILLASALGFGVNVTGAILIAVVCLWGIRLTANWAYTFHGLDCQDWRYTMLKEKTGGFYPIVNFFGIHLIPTLIVYLCTIPTVYVLEIAPDFNWFALPFAILSLLAVILQGVSDLQMHKFRRLKTGGFIRTGLWKYSRHPNYLGEILMWWGVGVYSAISVGVNLFLVGATLNTLLFLFVSIPMADKRQSRKEGFEDYKKNTRILLPIYKKQV